MDTNDHRKWYRTIDVYHLAHRLTHRCAETLLRQCRISVSSNNSTPSLKLRRGSKNHFSMGEEDSRSEHVHLRTNRDR